MPKSKPTEDKPLPKVSIIDRRLLNPFATPDVPIVLKTEGQWAIRWVYSKSKPGRLYDMTHHKGWVFVEPGELMGSVDEYGLTAKDNRLVRGDHGEEVLMKMPLEDYHRVQKAKNDYNLKQLGQKEMRESAAQATALAHGSEAGDAVFNALKNSNIVDSRGSNPEMESETA